MGRNGGCALVTGASRGIGAAAARVALERAEVHPTELDLILIGTFTQYVVLPNVASLVAAALVANRAGGVDLGVVCMCFLSVL